MRILVATPVCIAKEYSLQRWLSAVSAFTYEDVEFLWLDNSPNMELYNRWCTQISIWHVDPHERKFRQIAMAMEYIRLHFLASDCDKWLNLESDVIAPTDLIERLLEQGDYDWLSQPCPARGGEQLVTWGFACALFSKKLATELSFANAPRSQSPDGWYLEQIQKLGGFRLGKASNSVKLVHLKE